jgi:hypothetical protein
MAGGDGGQSTTENPEYRKAKRFEAAEFLSFHEISW